MGGELVARGRVVFQGTRSRTSKGGRPYSVADFSWVGGRNGFMVDGDLGGEIAKIGVGEEVEIEVVLHEQGKQDLRSVKRVGGKAA